MPRRWRTACHEDRAIVVEIDSVLIMIWRWFMDRGAADEMFGRHIVSGVAMALWSGIAIVLMTVFVAVAMIMTRHMDVRPIGMPRSLCNCLVRMRHCSPAEKQMCVHEQYEE